MKNVHSKLVSYLLAFALALGGVSFTTTAAAGEAWVFDTKPTAGNIALDLVIMRPVMLAGSVLGAAAFVVSLPFSLLGDNVQDSFDTLVAEPVQYTFIRPLGEI